jgi:hypothetical protein
MLDFPAQLANRPTYKTPTPEQRPHLQHNMAALDPISAASMHGTIMTFKSSSYERPKPKPLKQMLMQHSAAPPANVNAPTFTNIEATPSLLPAKRYCDITGLPSNYCDPVTKARYYNQEVFEKVKRLGVDGSQPYLALRNSEIVLK